MSLITAAVNVNVFDRVRHTVIFSTPPYNFNDFFLIVSLHMSVITQNGSSALTMAACEGRTEVVSLLLEAGANTNLQNEVKFRCDLEF